MLGSSNLPRITVERISHNIREPRVQRRVFHHPEQSDASSGSQVLVVSRSAELPHSQQLHQLLLDDLLRACVTDHLATPQSYEERSGSLDHPFIRVQPLPWRILLDED